MKIKILISAAVFFITFTIFNGSAVLADSNLEVAADSNFSNQTTNFSAGQQIYVRINTDSSGEQKHQLNLRDNSYSLIKFYNLNKNGNLYSTNFNAPQGVGYYSLEAEIVSAGRNVTNVKTIKDGSPNNANVSVRINNETSTSGNNQKEEERDTKDSDNSDNIEAASPSPSPEQVNND